MWSIIIMCFIKPWPGHLDQFWVSCVQYDPHLLWKNGIELDAGSWIRYIWSSPILAAHLPWWPQLAVTKMLPDWIWHVCWDSFAVKALGVWACVCLMSSRESWKDCNSAVAQKDKRGQNLWLHCNTFKQFFSFIHSEIVNWEPVELQ